MSARLQHCNLKQLTVQYSALTYIGRKLPFCTGEQRHVQLLLFGRKVIASDDDGTWRQSEIVRTFKLGSSDAISSVAPSGTPKLTATSFDQVGS